MEPHAAIADWEGDKLTLYGSYQMLKYNRNELAYSLGIDAANVRIVSPYVGGGFGSKLGIASEAVAAAIAAKEVGHERRSPICRMTAFPSRSPGRRRFSIAASTV